MESIGKVQLQVLVAKFYLQFWFYFLKMFNVPFIPISIRKNYHGTLLMDQRSAVAVMWSYDLIVEETCIYQNCGWCLTNETDLTFTNSIKISVWSIQLFILHIITLRRTLICFDIHHGYDLWNAKDVGLQTGWK